MIPRDGLNGNTAFVYDVFGRQLQVTDPNQGVTQYVLIQIK